MIDTHCHLDFSQFDSDRKAVIERFLAAGVEKAINVGTGIESSRRSVALAKENREIFASVGVHPHDAAAADAKAVAELRGLAKERKVVAVGEIGLDYYKNLSPREKQIGVFKDLIKLSIECGLPMIVHSRDAAPDTMKTLREVCGRSARGVMHCFSGGEDFLSECLEMGLYISFTGSVTFTNAGRLRGVAKNVPPDRLLLETDSPFMAPQEFRGKRNEPAYLKYVCAEMAGIKGISEGEIARLTAENSRRLFGI